MKKLFRALSVKLLVLSLLLPVAAQTAGAGSQAGRPDGRTQSTELAKDPGVASAIKLFESLTEAHMANRALPGMSIGIVFDQQLVWARGFGYADLGKRVPATPSTVYRVGSITKPFTATAVMQLRDQGKLQLDDPVVKYLPWFKVKSRFPEGPAITVRQLLSHSSGLPSEAAFPYWTDGKFPSREQIIESLPQQEAVFEPETKLKYSNLNYFLLGEIVSAVSGTSYADYVRKNILDPLGMRDTTIFPSESERSAVGYGRLQPGGRREVMPPQDMKGVAAAGNMSSTVTDLARFASLQFTDARAAGPSILKASTIREMRRVQAIRPDWRGGFGLGFTLRPYGGGVYIGHEGQIPGFRSRMRIAPEERLAVIVLTNADDGDTAAYTDLAFEVIGPELRRAAAVATPRQAAQFDPEWEQYVGKYSDPSTDYEVLRMKQELVLVNLANGSTVRLTPEGKNRFRITAPIADGVLDGDVVAFEFGPGRTVTRMKLGENYLPRRD